MGLTAASRRLLAAGARPILKRGRWRGSGLVRPHGNDYRKTLANNPPIHHMLLTAQGHVRSKQAGRLAGTPAGGGGGGEERCWGGGGKEE